jgi:hypothetical protein
LRPHAVTPVSRRSRAAGLVRPRHTFARQRQRGARRREAPRIPANGYASIAILDPTAGTIHIAVHNAKTAQLEAGRYIDALQVTIGDVVPPLWTGQILVAANPRRVLLT